MARSATAVAAMALALLGAACTPAAEAPPVSDPSTPATAMTTTTTTPANPPTIAPTPAPLDVVSGRAAHTATTLLDGSLLLAGGCVTDGCGTATAETFLVSADGAGAIPGPTMSTPRDAHSATLLPDGRVLLVGGYAGEGQAPLASVDVYDPVTQSILEVGSLATGRGGHAAALTGDGRVLVVGGWVGLRSFSASTELFDPDSRTLSAGPDLPWAAGALEAVALGDGRVLVTGGQIEPAVATDAAAVFDPATDTWTMVDALTTPRFKHASVLLDDGSVLTLGGSSDDETLLATTEIFDPATGTFHAGPEMNESRYKLTGGAVAIDQRRVVVAGGGRSVEVIDVGAGTSHVVATFPERGSFATLSLLGSGELLVLGGYDDRTMLRRESLVVGIDA